LSSQDQTWKAPDSWVVAPDGSNLDVVGGGKSDLRSLKSRNNSTFYSNLPHKIEQSINSPVSPILEDDMAMGVGSTDQFNVSMSNVVRSGGSKLRASNASLAKGSEKLASINFLFNNIFKIEKKLNSMWGNSGKYEFSGKALQKLPISKILLLPFLFYQWHLMRPLKICCINFPKSTL
jgi:hypothetical protein